jgi:signal transduction histidine kinase/ActR/RegA family two-component response regulator
MITGNFRRLEVLLDWFTPDLVRDDPHARKRMRMFLISHLFGPIIGLPIPLSLYLYDPSPWPHVHVLAASIAIFWLFPFALKVFPNHYTSLAFFSVFNLGFAILWGSYHYGGVNSPFLMWFLVMPLLAFFYLGSSMMTRVVIFAEITIGLGALYSAYLLENSFPKHIPIENMVEAGVVSAFCAATYVFLMASYYSRVVDSQSELLKEIERHQDTLLKLTDAKDEADRANNAKSEFLAKMSHELRTPLNAVLGYSEILLEDAEIDGNGEQIADLQKISAAGKHLLAMVNDILDISKIEAGKMELHLETVDLGHLIDEVELTGRPLATKNTNSFAVQRGENLGSIVSDATKLRQTIFNLLSNAAKFTHNGQITLTATRSRHEDGEWITISVRDTGIGIGVAQQAALFSNFSQASASITAKYGGTGLGLSLSQNLCRLMGGNISVESELGHGATFTIRLPVKSPERHAGGDGRVKMANADVRQRNIGNSGLSGHSDNHETRERILLVDDDHAFLELTERLLQKEGYSPVSTDTPRTVLQLARSVRPSVILVDVLMPGFDGWEVLEMLKSDPATSQIPVVMLSILEERKQALDKGADGFLAKPLDGRQLQTVLKSLKKQVQKSPEPRALAG